MVGEEFFHASIEIDLVFGAGETMPFVGIDDVDHLALCLAQRRDHYVRIRDRHPRIVFALANEKGRPDGIDMIKRRDFSVPVLVVVGISLAATPTRQYVGPVFGKETKARPLVGGSKFINAARKEIGLHFQRSQGGKTSHRPTHRRDPFWIRDPLIHGPTRCIKKVLHHPKPNLKIASIEELDAETDRAAVIYLKNSIAAICQELHFGIVAIVIAIPWPAMNQQHEREIF